MYRDLTVTTLPPEGFRAVLRAALARRDTATLRTLAARRDLPDDVARALAEHGDWRVARPALAHVSDPEVLANAAAAGERRLEGAVRNAACPVSVLTAACSHTSGDVRLWAWANTSTPLAARQKSMTPISVQQVLESGKNNADRAARAWALASANTWLAEKGWAWTITPLARALACCDEVGDELISGRGGPIGRAARRGRLAADEDLFGAHGLDVEAWAARGSAIVDLAVVRDERLGLADAVRMWTASRHTEPHVLAALAERFGYELACVEAPTRSTARDLAVQRLSDVAYAVANVCRGAAPLVVPDGIDGDRGWWDRVVALSHGWAGTLDELFECASAV